MKIAAALAVGFSTVSLAGCGGNSQNNEAPTAPPGTTPTEPTRELSGFGARVDSWNATHTEDHRFAAGAAYDPSPGLGPNERFNDRYYTVMATEGRILGYSLRLESGTSIAEARAAILREFPADARVDWFAVRSTCAQMQVRSVTLGKALRSPAIGDPKGSVFVEFSSGEAADSYAPGSVTDALLMVLAPTSVRGAPGC